MWEMPFLKTATGIKKTLLGGWQLAGSAIFQSGNPINVTNGATFPNGDYNADGSGGDRPNTPTGSVKTSGWSDDEYLAGIFRVNDFPVPLAERTATWYATPIAVPDTRTSACRSPSASRRRRS